MTPFAGRAVDRGLSAILAALVRLPGTTYNPNQAAGQVDRTAALVQAAVAAIARRAEEVTQSVAEGQKVQRQLQNRLDRWLREAAPKPGGAKLGYQPERDGLTRPLLQKAGLGEWDTFTCLGSLRDVEPSVNLLLDDRPLDDGYGKAIRPRWRRNLPGRWRFRSPLQQTQVPGRPDKREEMADGRAPSGRRPPDTTTAHLPHPSVH